MQYHFKVHREGHGYWAECIELEGCVTQADSKGELHANMAEALNSYLEEPTESNMRFPLPKKSVKLRGVVKVPVEPRIAFSVLLRNLRIRKKLTQRDVADRIGMKNLYSYQRLESSRTANPALSTIARIKRVFPEFRLDEVV